MEIEIGEYVRTSDGKIGKFIRIEFDEVDESLKWYVFLGKDKFGIEREIYRLKPYIVAHSKNIIDLIEVGDFVNGVEVIAIDTLNDGTRYCVVSSSAIYDVDIKKILTKEQYNQNCYVVKE